MFYLNQARTVERVWMKFGIEREIQVWNCTKETELLIPKKITVPVLWKIEGQAGKATPVC